MLKLFIAGKSGQVAVALKELAAEYGFEAACFGRPEFDLADKARIDAAVRGFSPDLIINAAAYTAVDQAESEEEIANTINADGPAALAAVARDLKVPFFHISTDYVFDGTKDSPYVETDTTGPTGAYGRSKLKGERAVLAANPDALIFRTAWVYSVTGKNFVKTMLTLASRRDQLGVVADQQGNPSYAPDIARALLEVGARILNGGWQAEFGGLYHLAGTGDTNWHAFALAIFEAGAAHGHPVPKVAALTTAEYPTPAQRPANSRLDCAKLAAQFGVKLPDWHESLKLCVDRLFADGTFESNKN